MSRQTGLTLIELMIGVAIVAILLTVGAPAIQTVLEQNKVIATVNDISNAARTARFTAIDTEETTLVCPSADYKSCSGDWRQAKIVFVDSNGNGSRDDAEPLISSSDPVSSGVNISGHTGALVFSPDGSVSNAVTIKLCPASGDAKSASAVLISLYGRVAVAVDNSGNGIKEDLAGADLTCS